MSERFVKFLHEKIAEARPSMPTEFSYRLQCQAILKAFAAGRRFQLQDYIEFCLEHEADLLRMPGYKQFRKGDLAERLSFSAFMLMEKDLVARNVYYSISRCMFPEHCPVYLFGEGFFQRLRKLDVSKLTFSVFDRPFRGVLKFPAPLHDADGFAFDEVFFVIDDSATVDKVAGITKGRITLKDRQLSLDEMGDRYLTLSWIARGPMTVYPSDGKQRPTEAPSYFSTTLPKDGSIPVSAALARTSRHESGIQDGVALRFEKFYGVNSYDATMNTLLAAAAYVLSGNPDLRTFENPIRRQSEGSSKPVRADKELSRVPIHLVNYGWNKPPLYRVGSWPVEEFERLQPYGPGLKQTRIVTIGAHERFRRKPGLMPGQNGEP